ncbi:exodeoxyribonuclease VII large subunit [Thermoleptolyngbya sichuanensis A183]|uniref:Exodeoxyribonuclease 7 large subunit n=1 Tax=Thermoleptolyngbya sichuanensis A183 TaxID=2737172 RepID=A0A6M8BEC8_9CYAN|nr:exodeoxyribonuclease VII large subunit [Thermoleptolyngbya sichuanensis A183]
MVSSSLRYPNTALSVGGLTHYIQSLLEDDEQLQQVWVTGEVSSVNPHRSGLFLTLQDPDEQAAINAVVWNSQLDRLAVMPVRGEQVIVLGQIKVYPARGSYQLTIWQVLPAGEGLRSLRHRQLRNRLEAEGLFDPDRKRPLPPHPRVVAVVTSPQAAAWGDIQRTLSHRYSGLRVLLSPAMVQGELAPSSIAQAIRRVEQDGRADVLILSRGGGAAEDLDCFNDERVVRAVAECSIPVITGIGHQRDESLADLAADLCAHTPTAAAEAVVPILDDLVEEHQQRCLALYRVAAERVEQEQRHVARLRDRLSRLRLDRQVHQRIQVVASLRQRLIRSTQQRLQQTQQHTLYLRQTLQTLDPALVLRRGYAVVRQEDGAIARSAGTLRPGDRLTITLAQGELVAEVKSIP